MPVPTLSHTNVALPRSLQAAPPVPWWHMPLYYTSGTSSPTLVLPACSMGMTSTSAYTLPNSGTMASSCITYNYYLPPVWTSSVPPPVQTPQRADRRPGRDPGEQSWLDEHAGRHVANGAAAVRRATRERAEEQRRRILEGEDRALAWLRDCLSPEQRAEFAERGFFHVTSRTGRRFRLLRGTMGNIIELDAVDREVAAWCVHPRHVPLGDSLLAQKLWLEDDAEALLRLANRHR